MVRSLVTLAHDLGMRVIAEGIETQEQLTLIEDMGGNEAQGYLLGRPTPNPAALLRGPSPNSTRPAISVALCVKAPRSK